MPFDSAQARVHVAEAVFKAIQVLARKSDSLLAGIALPSTKHHRDLFATVQTFLADHGVRVFWVDGDGSVTVSGAWEWQRSCRGVKSES